MLYFQDFQGYVKISDENIAKNSELPGIRVG